LEVTLDSGGPANPDTVLGTYSYAGCHNDQPYWEHNSEPWVIWFSGGNKWVISTLFGGEGDHRGVATGGAVEDIYAPLGFQTAGYLNVSY